MKRKILFPFILLINIWFWVFFFITSAILVVGAVLIRLTTQFFDPNLKILHQYSCFWASLYIWFNPFWSSQVAGKENVVPNKAYLMVSNHQSMADILILFNTFIHFKWVSKKSMFNAPFLGWNMRLNGYIPIERGNEESRAKMMDHCRSWLKKGSPVLFFPEGTRSKDGLLLPFKKGAFRLAIESQVDVLPIKVEGSLHAIPKHSVLLHRQSKMKVTILKPFAITPYVIMAKEISLDAAVDKLTEDVRQLY